MKITNKKGAFGEEYSCRYLEKKGYKIIERNFRVKYEEIDIIALNNSTIIFIEVKTRSSNSFGEAVESITRQKLIHLERLAQYFKSIHPELPQDMRLDLIAVTINDQFQVSRLEHIENISIY